jgi:hypothetical protein
MPAGLGCRLAVGVKVVGGSWTRKHDDPRHPYIPEPGAECILYADSLAELISACRDRRPDERLKAVGSHWALSTAAVSDHTFIETHDPQEDVPVLGRTLTNVIPRCLNLPYVERMQELASEDMWYLAHVEAGKRIYQLYAELDQPVNLNDCTTLGGFIKKTFDDARFSGPWAFETLGGAGGQTIVGAFATGTHGGDFDRPPVSDSVLALHLVADGGKHYWIEPIHPGVPELTDDERLLEQYGIDAYGGRENFEIIRDSNVFDAALVSVGRFGVIYSVVLKAVPQYELRETRKLHLWQDIRDQIKNPDSGLYRAEPNQRFLQIAVCLTTHLNFQQNLVGVTRRWTRPLTLEAPGRIQRVGEIVDECDELLQAPRFSLAGKNHPYSPHDDDPHRAAPPSIMELACADASFLKGILTQVRQEIEEFVTTQGAAVGATIAAVSVIGGGALLLLIPALLIILPIITALLDEFDDETRFGEAMEEIKNRLLDPPSPDPLTRAAGLYTWQLIYYLAFRDQQKERDFSAISYAVMDAHDYLNTSCEVNVDSIEVFFDGTDDRLTAFIDTLIAFEMNQEFQGKAFVGYASLRFMKPTRALIGMQRWPLTCSVEVACVKDVSGGKELIDFALDWARNPNNGAILHWGQRNEARRDEIERIFGQRLETWRQALRRIGDGSDAFSSDFTRRTGLEAT